MAYATQADIVEIYSEDALYVADRDGDGVVDADAVGRALQAASGQIDSFIGVRYALPLSAADDLLKQYCVDIAIYLLASGRNVQSDEHRQRFEDALKHLEKIGAGKANLIVPHDIVGADGAASSASAGPRPIVVGGPERQFTREKMQGL
jgi:phage gp36-like protein